MGRLACVDLPAFPLQLLLRRHPDWREHPVAVVDKDTAQGKLLWVNERARASRLLPGMRYAAALSLVGKLRAAEVSSDEIERQARHVARRLRNFTPHVEPSSIEPGVFWLDAAGLRPLFESLTRWSDDVRSDLKRFGFDSTLVLGFRRFDSYALARSKRGVILLANPREERAAARRVPLDRLALEPAVRDTLAKLDVRTVGEFVDLPHEGVHKRFGGETARLHKLAQEGDDVPLQPEQPHPPAVQRQLLDYTETKVSRILVVVERLLGPLLAMLAERAHALARLHVGLRFERMGDHVERVAPACPTLDAAQLLDLVRLRLEAVRKLPDGVVEILLAAESVAATRDQLRLFEQVPQQNLAAAERALARVRAELGDGAVVRARLREGHLPEACFSWEPVAKLAEPAPRAVDGDTLVRRIYVRPVPLPSRPRHEPDGWMLRGLEQGPVVRVRGPYIVSGGWWNRAQHREYHFAETRKGELLWVYYDRARRRWFMQGRVE